MCQKFFFIFLCAVFASTYVLSAQEHKKLVFTNVHTKKTVTLQKGSRVLLVYKDCNGRLKKVEDNIWEITDDGIELGMLSSGGRTKRGFKSLLDNEPKMFEGDTKVLYQDIIEFKKVFKIKPIISAVLSATVGIAAYYIIRNQFKDPRSFDAEGTAVLAALILPPLVDWGFKAITRERSRDKMEDGWKYQVE